MGLRWYCLAASLLAALVAPGCGRVEAQGDPAPHEHAVFEWARFKDAKEEQERYSFATASGEVVRDNASAFFGDLGFTADSQRNTADRVAVLNYLARKGWLVVNRTDVAYADAGGSAMAERYLLRRRRGG